MHTYLISPIDFAWEHLKTVEETARELGAKEAAMAASERIGPLTKTSTFLDDWTEAQRLATANGWEGDFKNDPAVFWIPCDGEFRYGFAIKQNNNGSTFVVTPIRMAWLEDL